MKRSLALAAVLLVALASSVVGAPAASSAGVAGYGLAALATGVRYQFNSPGFLPVGDPAEGTIGELDVPIARTGISQGPLINALASPAYPGDTVAHLGTAVGTFSPEAPVIPNYPVVAEANFPPTPLHGASASFGQAGLGDGTATASADGAKVIANTVAQSIAGVIDVASSSVRNDLTVSAAKITSTAVSTTGAISIAGMITIGGVIGTAEAVSDGVTATPKARLEIGKVTAAGQAAFIDRDGVHLVTSPVLGSGVIASLQTLLNQALAADGIDIRTIAPDTTMAGGAAAASSGALAITINRLIPAISIPGVPALEIPGANPVILGTPDLPTHTEVLIGGARVATNATSLAPFLPDVAVPSLDVSGDSTSADFSTIAGAGSSLEGALATTPTETGQPDFAAQPAAARGSGRGIPVGWIIVGIFGAFVVSGPLLGYARWQLLEGRHR